MLKRIDWLMLRTFIGPLVMNFLIILLILVLQFVSMYIRDIMGKGIGPEIFFQLFFYASGHLSLSAMPVALLAAALMTLGGMGERYELATIKSSGISVFRASRMLIVLGLVITLLTTWFSFNVVPKSNLKFFSLIYDVKRKKADIALQPGHFYKDIDNYAIRIADKHKDNGMLYKVRIYHYVDNQTNGDIIQADSARMGLRKDRLEMILYHGTRYEEVAADKKEDEDNYPFSRTSFDSLIYVFDLGDDFELNRTDESQFKHQITLTHNQLGQALDSIKVLGVKQDEKTFAQLARYNKVDTILAVLAIPDSTPPRLTVPVLTYDLSPEDSLIDCLWAHNPADILTRAITNARAAKSYLEFAERKKDDQFLADSRYSYEYHLRIALPINCLLFLLIGVSLGAIIRKGGLGVPALVSISLFILFYVLTTYGRKAAKDGNIDPWFGAWISVLVFTPLALALVYQATTDSRLLDESQWGMIRDRFLVAYDYVRFRFRRQQGNDPSAGKEPEG